MSTKAEKQTYRAAMIEVLKELRELSCCANELLL